MAKKLDTPKQKYGYRTERTTPLEKEMMKPIDTNEAFENWWSDLELPMAAPKLKTLMPNDERWEVSVPVQWHTRRGLSKMSTRGLPEWAFDMLDIILVQLNKEHLHPLSKRLHLIHMRKADEGRIFIWMRSDELKSPKSFRCTARIRDWLELGSVPELGGLWLLQNKHQPRAMDFRVSSHKLGKLSKIFGPDTLHVQVGEDRVFYTPMDTPGQNNEMSTSMSEQIATWIKSPSSKKDTLINLFTGPTAWLPKVSPMFNECWVADHRLQSQESFRINRERHELKNSRWVRLEGSEAKRLKMPKNNLTSMVIDTPVEGFSATLLKALCEFENVQKIVRILRNPEHLPAEWWRWRKEGWMVSKIGAWQCGNGQHPTLCVLLIPERGRIKETKKEKKEERRANYTKGKPQQKGKNRNSFGNSNDGISFKQ